MKEESSGMCLLDYLHRAETFSSLGVGEPREPIPYYPFHQDHRHNLLLVITSFKTRPTHSRTGSWHLCMPPERWRHSSTCSNKQNTCDRNLLKSLLHTWRVLYNLREDWGWFLNALGMYVIPCHPNHVRRCLELHKNRGKTHWMLWCSTLYPAVRTFDLTVPSMCQRLLLCVKVYIHRQSVCFFSYTFLLLFFLN